LAAGTRTSSSESPLVTDARSDHFPWTSCALNPGLSVSTRKPRTKFSSSSTFAQITATSAIFPDVIHIFSPFRMYSSPDFRAVVVIPPGLDPNPGSVSPKQPSFSPRASAGSQVLLCSSDPNV